MPMNHEMPQPDQPTVQVRFDLETPAPLTGKDEPVIRLLASPGQSLLEVALAGGINIEHACGGVCACSTCHVYITDGETSLNEPTDEELDRVEEAPAIRPNSRLACQCKIEGPGPIAVRVPAWNRNAIKEVPH